MKTPIHDFLLEHAAKNPVSFHMPGHKGSALYRRLGYSTFLERMVDCDVTEIVGADNLFQAEGIIKEAQDRYAKLYGVQKSYLLINGTSGGIIAAVLAAVPRGGKLIMARNSHKSVFNALNLAGAKPVYAYPDLLGEHGISGPISPKQIEELLASNPDAHAVILPSPNYYGVCSDIEAIAAITRKYQKVLIVDEAHGAHLAFFNRYGTRPMPKAEEHAGADIVIASVHKTLASFTQSAVLHLTSDRVDASLLEDKLQCVESTSPSYLLMASLDINASILEERGARLFAEWEENLNFFYEQAAKIKGLRFIGQEEGMDWSKLNFSLGIHGAALEQTLIEEYGVFIELYTGDMVMCMTGIGNTRAHIEKLVNALGDIAAREKPDDAASALQTADQEKERGENLFSLSTRAEIFEVPTVKRRTPLSEADGLICASSIIPYPPGIPLVCPGEKLNADTIRYIKRARELGEKVIGVNENGEILTGTPAG